MELTKGQVDTLLVGARVYVVLDESGNGSFFTAYKEGLKAYLATDEAKTVALGEAVQRELQDRSAIVFSIDDISDKTKQFDFELSLREYAKKEEGTWPLAFEETYESNADGDKFPLDCYDASSMMVDLQEETNTALVTKALEGSVQNAQAVYGRAKVRLEVHSDIGVDRPKKMSLACCVNEHLLNRFQNAVNIMTVWPDGKQIGIAWAHNGKQTNREIDFFGGIHMTVPCGY